MNISYRMVFALVFIFILSCAIALQWHYGSKTVFKQDRTAIEPIRDYWGPVSISADPRLELLASIELNSRFYNIVKYDSQYKSDMAKHFKPVRNHKAVKLFQLISKNGIYVDAPPTMMLYLSGVPEMKLTKEVDAGTIMAFTKNLETTENFITELQNYALVSGMQDFFKEHEDFYKSNIQAVKNILMQNDYVNDIEQYYGQKQKSYNIILSPLFEGNYGPRIESEEGYDLYAIIGGCDVKDGYDENMIRYLIWHEFSHSFINPLSQIEQNKSRLDSCQDNFNIIKDKVAKQGYTSWINSVNEHVIRAVTVRLTYKKLGGEAAKKLIEEEKDRGFIYIEDLCKQLEFYEQNRDKYTTLEKFYPELIKVFEKVLD